MREDPRRWASYLAGALVVAAVFPGSTGLSIQPDPVARQAAAPPPPVSDGAPMPLLREGQPVDWWFVFKFNAATFPGCGAGSQRTCVFGGDVQSYKAFGQQFVYASSDQHALQQGTGCAGETPTDPIGATFGQVYSNAFHYVIWSDQFYGDPPTHACRMNCNSPWAHSKGMLAWDETGEGFVLQVSTPSWPGSGSNKAPRKADGNTLGCVKDNDVELSQQFFALKVTKDDLVKVLKALGNASVVTDPGQPQIVNNGGPEDVQSLVNGLGTRSDSKTYTIDTLSTGVQMISKPARLNVPPWQMVSAALGGVSLRAATWWANPKIPTTTASSSIACWDGTLGQPGAVEIATTGAWAGTAFALVGGVGPSFNHAKVGVSTSGDHSYSIFGDMNQQGSLSGPNCSSSQNGRGGLFYVMDDGELFGSVKDLIHGDTAPSPVKSPDEGANAIGDVPAAEPIQVTLVVRRRPGAVLPDPTAQGANAAGRQRVSREEFAALYGADPADLKAVEDFVAAEGFTLVEVHPEARTISIRGTAAQFQRTFKVGLKHYDSELGQYRGTVGEVHVPPSIAPLVDAVLGLDDRPRASPRV